MLLNYIARPGYHEKHLHENTGRYEVTPDHRVPEMQKKPTPRKLSQRNVLWRLESTATRSIESTNNKGRQHTECEALRLAGMENRGVSGKGSTAAATRLLRQHGGRELKLAPQLGS
jgi:hypothetical protein